MATKVNVTWHGGNRFVGLGASGTPVLINFAPGETPPTAAPPPAAAASPATQSPGPYPTELLLIAVGACTGLDVVTLLVKQRASFSALDVEVTGERAPEHPKYFTDVQILYRLTAEPGVLPRLERAAEMSMAHYCGVSQSLRAERTWRCECVSSPSESG